MTPKTDNDRVYIRGLLEQRIVQLKAELAKAKNELAKLDSTLPTGLGPQIKRGNSKTKRIEELIMSVVSTKGMTVGEIFEAVRKHDPDLNESLIRRTLSRLGKAGELENVERGVWRQKDFISKTLGV